MNTFYFVALSIGLGITPVGPYTEPPETDYPVYLYEGALKPHEITHYNVSLLIAQKTNVTRVN